MPPGNDEPSSSGEKKTADKAEKKAEKSYLATAVESMNSWTTSRNTSQGPKARVPLPKTPPVTTRKADDHSTNTLYGQSFKRYPAGCPPLNVLWFHAVDVPKRKPDFLKSKKEADVNKPIPTPKKFMQFSTDDSRSIENSYQKLLEELENERGRGPANKHVRTGSQRRRAVAGEDAPNTSIDNDTNGQARGLRVPVNEDFLFDVDIEKRELAPVYWLGPVYEVRRGTWFYQEGSSLRPCEENLAAQLEEGYLKLKPWTTPTTRIRSDSEAQDITPKASAENLRSAAKSQAEGTVKPLPAQSGAPNQPQTYRLFGTYMNSVATYQDSTTAWLSSESVFSWVTSTVYQRFAGGSYMNGIKLVRGYVDPAKTKEVKRPPTPTTATLPVSQLDDKQEKVLKRRSAPPSTRSEATDDGERGEDKAAAEAERSENRLKRQFSSFVETSNNPEEQEEQIRQREEQEIQDDYTGQDGETQNREIEHLVLVTHGIGQLLGLRMESVNFVHDVNVLRKTIKGVYAHSADLKTLNSENGEEGPGNCKIQVLPVCWRHLLDFPKRREKKGETDLGDLADDEDEYPSLEAITVEGVAFARSLISDLALDVLLYQSAYREQISEIVLKESNRIYKLFTERNPGFKGKVHIIGHSLGSAVMFDILCRQKEKTKPIENLRNPLRFWPSEERSKQIKDPRELAFEFNVDDFYALGSPIGLFQMLKGRTIAARHQPNAAPSESPLNPEYMADPFLAASSMSSEERVSAITGLPFSVSSPKASQLFNIFHPSDPIAYRLEPLISTAMSSLKPQLLPYTKKGIFGAVAPQGLSGIGVKVGQSVSGLWSSFSAGIASSLLNRSLGLSNEDVANFNAANSNASQSTLPSGAGTNIVAGGTISDTTAQSERTEARKKALARQNSSVQRSRSGTTTPNALDTNNSGSRQDATLIDDELETLFSRFQKKRIEEHKESISRAAEGEELGDAWAAEEQKAQKLRREELKVRALNRNGRVDYSIQEGALDFNPINTIASHLSYWQDEDVIHFIVSQLLANKSRSSGSGESDIEGNNTSKGR